MKRYLLLRIPVLCSFKSVAQSDYKYHTDDSLIYVWARALFQDPLLSPQQRSNVWHDSIVSVCKSRNIGIWSSFGFGRTDTNFMYMDTVFLNKAMAEKKRLE